MTQPAAAASLGVVVIGRNEGARLDRCLESLRLAGPGVPIVYVDSGSTDGSPALARARGADLVALDPARGFTMARGRNAGARRLVERLPGVELIQFLDGDCEMQPAWLEAGRRAMQAHPEAAAVSGRRRERRRNVNAYHRLMDMEWDTPIGESAACHGDVMMRVSFLQAAGLFDESLIAGEEPELCARLRGAGGRILRIDAEMSLHDAAIESFPQWWRRCVRSGHGQLQVVARHGWRHDPALARELIRPWLWVCLVPLAVLAAAIAWSPWALLGLLVYPLHAALIARGRLRRGDSVPDAALYAASILVGRLPVWLGHWSWIATKLRRRESTLIEYKDSAKGAA